MSLSGNLGFVSLDEVLRLLTRSGQRGRVAVKGQDIQGRVFVTKGGITLATTYDDQQLQTLLLKSALVDSHELADGAGLKKDDPALIELLREITVESIYKLNLHGDSFDVTADEEARFASPKPFDLEQLLEDSRKRLEDWAEVSQVVSDLESKIRFERDLGEREEVTIKRDAWKVLSEVGAGASVSQIAAELGTTEFWAARIVARLVEDDLLQTDGGADAPGVADSWATPVSHEPAVSASEPEYGFGYEEPAQTPADEPVATHEETVSEETGEQSSEMPFAHGVPSDEDEALDPNQSWWEEPAEDASASKGDESSGDSEDDVEEDTEAFLEKVFSELDTEEETEDEGYGLLRRRKLGAMRDIPRDT